VRGGESHDNLKLPRPTRGRQHFNKRGCTAQPSANSVSPLDYPTPSSPLFHSIGHHNDCHSCNKVARHPSVRWPSLLCFSPAAHPLLPTVPSCKEACNGARDSHVFLKEQYRAFSQGRSATARCRRLQRRWSRHPHRAHAAEPRRAGRRDSADAQVDQQAIWRQHHDPADHQPAGLRGLRARRRRGGRTHIRDCRQQPCVRLRVGPFRADADGATRTAGKLIKFFKDKGCVVIHKCTTIRHAKVCLGFWAAARPVRTLTQGSPPNAWVSISSVSMGLNVCSPCHLLRTLLTMYSFRRWPPRRGGYPRTHPRTHHSSLVPRLPIQNTH
jgi:hypothetical protein